MRNEKSQILKRVLLSNVYDLKPGTNAAGEFSSMSDLVNIALTEFFAKQESVKAEGRKVVIE